MMGHFFILWVTAILILYMKLLFAGQADELDDGVMKYTKATCTASGKSVKNLYCRVKPVSRKESYFSGGGTLIRPLPIVFADFKLHHKPLVGGNYVQMFKVDHLYACDLIKMAVSNMVSRYFLELANGTMLKGLIRECPYPAREYKIENATMDINVMKKWDPVQRYPNGEQRYDIRVFDKLDDNIFSLKLYNFMKIRSNTLRSYDKM